MVRTAWSVAGRWDGGDAKDVVQEALIAALTTPALPRGDVGAWLRAIIDERRGQLHEEAEATRERIRKILTPEQRDRFDEMGPPPPGPPGGPRPGDRRPVPRRPRPRRPQG